MRRLLVPVLAAVVLTGTVASTASADQQPPPVVTVLDPGATPRAALRYVLAPGTTQDIDYSFNTRLSQTVDGETASGSIPQIDMSMTAGVTAVAPDGAVTVPVSIGDIVVDEDAVGGDQVADAVEALTGFEMALTITDRGEVLSADAEIPDDLEETASQLLQQFVDQARSFTVPLPEEEVGVGARWKAVAESTISGISLRQTARYEVVDMDADSVDLDVTISQRAPRQTVLDPVSGEEVELLKSTGTGDGTITIAFDSPLPSESETHVQVRQRLRADGKLLSTRITVNAFLDPA
jgi:hypothetical protein